jgi:hypothetical protein
VIARVLASGLRHRPGYLLTVLVATAAATTALAAAAGLAGRLRAAVAAGDELGVNLLVRPQPGGPASLAASDGERLRALAGVAAVVPWAELGEVPLAGGARRPLLATSAAAPALHRGWQVEGRWPGAGETLAGADAGLAPGARVETPLGPLRVVGLLRTGEALDGALLVDLAALEAREASPPPGGPLAVQRFELRADPRRVEAVAGAAMRAVAGAEARPLLRVTQTRARLVARLTWILAGAGALTALLALGTLAAASVSQLHARRREIALFFALGYGRAWVGRLLALELLVAAAAAWLLGALAGGLLADRFARQLLGAAPGASTLAPTAAGAAAALAGAALVLAATLRLTARRLETLQPAALLAGR